MVKVSTGYGHCPKRHWGKFQHTLGAATIGSFLSSRAIFELRGTVCQEVVGLFGKPSRLSFENDLIVNGPTLVNPVEAQRWAWDAIGTSIPTDSSSAVFNRPSHVLQVLRHS
jgi:hypothetical protein